MSKAQYNQLVRKIVKDTKLLLSVSQKMMSERRGHQETNTDTSDDSYDDSSDDDVYNYNGEKYYYHPPEINERVTILWNLNDGSTNWSVATITKIRRRAGKKMYTVLYESGEVHQDYLRTTDFPEKWRFVDS